MNIEEMKVELQNFSDANNLGVDVNAIVQTMDSGDFIALSQAMDNSDNTTIIKILQRYRARVTESFSMFSSERTNMPIPPDVMKVFDYSINELTENYSNYVKGAMSNTYHLSLQEIRTLVYEDMNTNIRAQSSVQQNTAQTQTNQNNPDVVNRLKQTDITRNANNPNFKVSVPSDVQGQTSIQQVVGVDANSNPNQTLVVTKNPNASSGTDGVNVFNVNDVKTVDTQLNQQVQEEISPENACNDDGDDMVNGILSMFSRIKD